MKRLSLLQLLPIQRSRSLRRFWRQEVFRWVAITCILFILLTALAMGLYPGGTVVDHASRGYSFFYNFFSDLGMTHTRAAVPNFLCLSLFTTALTSVGSGATLFFVAFTQFFVSSPVSRWLSHMGSLFGIFTGLCFIGIALTPFDLYPIAHDHCVNWGFRSFLATTLIYIVAIWQERHLPKRLAWIFMAFALILAAYVLLLELGPSPKTPMGLVVQATGQKIIVYTAIGTILAQTMSAYRLAKG